MDKSEQTNVSSHKVIRFLHENHYMFVPPSNPPTPRQVNPVFRSAHRSTRDMTAAAEREAKCPFKFQVRDSAVDGNGYLTIPRFLSVAICPDCPANCQKVMYTHQLLIRKCKNVWMWTEKTLPVAYVWLQQDHWSWGVIHLQTMTKQKGCS